MVRAPRRRPRRLVVDVVRPCLAEPLEPRRLLSAVAWDGGGDNVHWEDPLNWTGDAVPGNADDVTIDVPGPLSVILRGNPGTVRSLVNRETLWVQGSNAFGHAALNATTSISNEGTLRLESIDQGWADTVSTSGGTITNSSGASILSEPGTGGPRTIGGNLDNSGTITADADLSGAGSGATFNQLAGSVTAASGARFTWDSGLMNFSGGTLSGAVYVRNGSLDVASSAGASTVRAEGLTLLKNNLSTSATVWVQGNNPAGHAQLATAVGAINRGTILLESTDQGWNSVIATDSGGFTNAATGVIRSNAGTGGPRSISGKLINQGSVDAGTNFIDVSGAYTAAGGTTSGLVALRAVNLSETAATTSPTTLLLYGATTLLSNNLSNMTLWVQGNNASGHASLTSASGFTNSGTILLESIDQGWTDSLTVTSGVLSNAAGGTIRANVGAGGPRVVTTNINNQGTIRAATDLSCPASGLTLNQQGGSIDATGGRFTWDAGSMSFSGGTLAGPVYVRNGSLDVAATAGASTVRLEGGCTLTNNLSTATTIWVQGNNPAGHAQLTTAAGASNRGTINLESIDQGWSSSILTNAGGFSNAATGVINSNAGTGGPRSINGSVINAGLVDASGYYIDVNGAYEAAGGYASANVRLHSVQLKVTAPTVLPTQLVLFGTTTLLTSNLANMTLWVQGNNIDGHASLTETGNITNDGTILLESIDQGWSESLTINGNLLNNGTLVTHVGTGGARTLSTGAIDGIGTVDLSSNATLQADRVRQTTLSVAGFAHVRPNGGNSGTSVVNNLSIPAGGTLDLDDNDLIVDYTGASQLVTIQNLIVSARNGGAWNGTTGLTSAAARVQPGLITGLGAVEATDYDAMHGGPGALFDGIDPDATAVLVKYTYNGDATLDGRITFDDYVRIDTGFNAHRTGWANGDFNYSGAVNFDDYVLIDTAFNTQGGTLGRLPLRDGSPEQIVLNPVRRHA